MASPVYVPRVNNNDDEVTLVNLEVAAGAQVRRGQVLAQVETDKAVLDVESSADGFVLETRGSVGEKVTVGKVLVWLGETADEAVPEEAAAVPPAARGEAGRTPTAKARMLLRRHGLQAADVAASGERLTEADVERHLGGSKRAAQAATRPAYPPPVVEGNLRELRPEEKGMLTTVTWHRDEAVPGYIEFPYDPQPWDAYAKEFGDRHKLLLGPLQSLMTWRLVQLARENPKLNATIVDGQRLEYGVVNPGFTVQVGETLYLAVLRDAASLDEKGFVNAMVDLQRRAAGHKLGALETQGATIGFSSMARWKVSRHVPILPPYTSFMVAHAVGPDGQAILAATYDHRVMNGFDVVTALRKLSKPAT